MVAVIQSANARVNAIPSVSEDVVGAE